MRSREAREKVDGYLDFRAALREVLERGDPKEFKLFLRDTGEDFADRELLAMARWSEEALLPVMHRMTIADAKLQPQHARARAWLREHGMTIRVRPTGYGWNAELRRRYRVEGGAEYRSRAG